MSETVADSMYDFRTVFWRSCRSADGSSAYPKAVDKAVKSSREARKGREVFFDRINMIYKILRGFEHRQNMVRKGVVRGV